MSGQSLTFPCCTGVMSSAAQAARQPSASTMDSQQAQQPRQQQQAAQPRAWPAPPPAQVAGAADKALHGHGQPRPDPAATLVPEPRTPARPQGAAQAPAQLPASSSAQSLQASAAAASQGASNKATVQTQAAAPVPGAQAWIAGSFQPVQPQARPAVRSSVAAEPASVQQPSVHAGSPAAQGPAAPIAPAQAAAAEPAGAHRAAERLMGALPAGGQFAAHPVTARAKTSTDASPAPAEHVQHAAQNLPAATGMHQGFSAEAPADQPSSEGGTDASAEAYSEDWANADESDHPYTPVA